MPTPIRVAIIVSVGTLGLLFIELVYLPAGLRGRDVGRRMIEMAEAEARRRGFHLEPLRL